VTRRLRPAVLWLLLGALLLACAWLVINTTFMYYDDEGFLLLSYRNFIGGAPLYDEVFSQYGPWPYLYHQLLTTVLQQPISHAFGRNLTALHWVICALCCGAIAARFSGRTLVAICTTLITFTLLWQMNAEPSHPGSLVAAMLAVLALAAAVLHDDRRWTGLGIVIGGVAALLLMTKINAGLLFVAGAGVAALRLTAWPERWRRPASILSVIGLLAVPWALMWGRLSEPWVLTFAVQFTAAAAGMLWVSPPALLGRPIPVRTWGVAAAVFLCVLALVICAICAQGTSLQALLDAVLFNPLRLPANFMFGLTFVPTTWPLAMVCVLVTAYAGWQLRMLGELNRATVRIVVALRLLAAVAFMINANAWLSLTGVGQFAVFCLPLLPVFLMSIASSRELSSGRPDSLLWIAAIALPQVLIAYPVAGSQMAFGTFLYVPVLVIGFAAALRYTAQLLAYSGRWLAQVGWGLLLLVASVQFATLTASAWDRYRMSQPLDLPGAAALRLNGPTRLTLRAITLNASLHADLLYSRPGMFSFNLWSGVPTPTLQNATQWFWLLSEPAQLDIVERLRSSARSAIVTNQALDEFIERIGVPTQSTLDLYIRGHYRPLFELHGFHFLVPLTQRAVPFGLIELASPDTGPTQVLQTNIVLAGMPARVQFHSAHQPGMVLAAFAARLTPMVLEPITAEGDIRGAALSLPVDRPLHGLFRLRIIAGSVPTLDQRQDAVLTVLAPDGEVLSESVF